MLLVNLVLHNVGKPKLLLYSSAHNWLYCNARGKPPKTCASISLNGETGGYYDFCLYGSEQRCDGVTLYEYNWIADAM